ncbi:MAG: histidine kinase [Chitinophagaceae bacterium]|nr:histidine kinase [Chitinophagaceae bacterium]
MFTRKLIWLQCAIWIFFFLFLLLYSVQKWETVYLAVASCAIGVSSYIISVYTNALWLIPRFWRKKRKAEYFILSIFFLLSLIFIRMTIEYWLIFPYYKHLMFYKFSLAQFLFSTITISLAFFFGAILNTLDDYFHLQRKQESMQLQQAAAELNLLKAQVQPHFLFNTLNNIYYLAYTKSDLAATVIARLSSIMRYFVDEAPKEKLPLSTEINFLKNYIELEQIRMLHAANLSFEHAGVDEMIRIPPMLLIPLVENIYKHGVDKSVPDNEICISLKIQEGYLHFNTGNTVHPVEKPVGSGVGLDNLRKRLQLLFGKDFTLTTEQSGNHYQVQLIFPV